MQPWEDPVWRAQPRPAVWLMPGPGDVGKSQDQLFWERSQQAKEARAAGFGLVEQLRRYVLEILALARRSAQSRRPAPPPGPQPADLHGARMDGKVWAQSPVTGKWGFR